MEIVGIIKVINPEIQVSASFKKREIVISTDEQYVQHILIEFKQDKCDVLSAYKAGENVKIGINIKGREWVNPQGETRYFNQIEGWKIERTTAAVPPSQEYINNQPPAQFAPATNMDEPDDLPF